MVDILKPRFVGPNQVYGVTVEPYLTPAGAETIRVMYENKELPSETMPMRTFEALVTDVPKDYNWLRETRYKNLLEEMAKVALEHDIQFCDVDYVTGELKKKFAAAFDRTTSLLWTGDDKQWVPGIPAIAYRTLLEADHILKEKIPPTTNESKPDTEKK